MQLSKRLGLRTSALLLMSLLSSPGFALRSSAADDKVDAVVTETAKAEEAAELVLTSPAISESAAPASTTDHAVTAQDTTANVPSDHGSSDHGSSDHGSSDHGSSDHGSSEHSSSDHAESPGILSFDLGSAIWNMIIFLLVLTILSKFVWPSILGGLQAREEKIRGDLEAAEVANAKAQSLLGDYQKKLDEASVQVQNMLAEARRDAEASGQRIVADAKAEAERQRERAIADIETAKKVAMADLAGSTADLAMKVARSVVGRELRAEDHADLVRQSLDRLPSQN